MATKYDYLEPRGWARPEWGQPSTEDVEFKGPGFGDPSTRYTTDNDD